MEREKDLSLTRLRRWAHHFLLFGAIVEQAGYSFFLELVALALDVEHRRMMKQGIENCRDTRPPWTLCAIL